ncbi:hypothetical protein SERLADRAFT_443797 [Serpula lacrymans var. lacrymans S7.9]|uniref:Uncharacterized protein n=1 Tax=Serpula lacrymans var. lacrymans (strain S7.9) TaxID=578457 RepID=F8PDK9_SERL9|nr:uncharacterized protein SERLADRAFT_443797 [Serpula lacrymans var. lacrymans S7.9]EGO18830.1 hypothetical protein SERLADRAFT_443797 [Serpula lacrymans var. lacrymans S7.9]
MSFIQDTTGILVHNKWLLQFTKPLLEGNEERKAWEVVPSTFEGFCQWAHVAQNPSEKQVDMLSQPLPPQDINALLHVMRTQIGALTSQLAKMQANLPTATPSVEKKYNKKVEVVADPGAFEGDRALSCTKIDW